MFRRCDRRTVWDVDLGNEYEGYSTPAPGHFDDDDGLDFFVSYGNGTWPEMDFTAQVVVDGTTGSITVRDSVGTFQYASPLTFDFTEDGRDDVLIAVNELEGGGPPVGRYVNELRVLDPHTGMDYRFKERRPGSNLGSTPLLTDLDGDGYLDVIYCYMETPGSFFSFSSATIERIETTIPIEETPTWGAYMGPKADGVFSE